MLGWVTRVGAVPGCRDGSREGFTDLLKFPRIAACNASAICDSNPPSNWTGVYLKYGEKQVCGECKALVDNMDTAFHTCDAYCKVQNLVCVDAWRPHNYTCTQHTNGLGCSYDFQGHGEGLCECSTVEPALLLLDTDVTSMQASDTFCSKGWHVCTGRDINAGRGDVEHHTAIATADARNFSGCYGYNANNDCNSCQDTCGSRSDGGHSGHGCTVAGGDDPDIAGMGGGCEFVSNNHACLSDGRLNLKHGNGCTIKAATGASGLVCCRDDYLEIAIKASSSKDVVVNGKTQTYQLFFSNRGIDFYAATYYAIQQKKENQRGHLAVFDSTAEVAAVSSLLADKSTTCDDLPTSSWIDVSTAMSAPCGKCKVLATNMRVHKTCANYCASQSTPLFCVGGWEERNNDCDVKYSVDCNFDFSTFTSDGICECSESETEGLLWVGGHESLARTQQGSAWYWEWAGAAVDGVYHNPFGYSFPNGSTSFPSAEHLHWNVNQPGTQPLADDYRCTYLDGSTNMSAQGCSVSSGMDGFVVEYSEPTLTTCAGGNVYELQFQLLNWNDALKTASSYINNGLPGHLLTLNSAAEVNCISTWLQTMDISLDYTATPFWTAGTRLNPLSPEWIWDTDGSKITLNSWGDGEPAAGGDRGLAVSTSGVWAAVDVTIPMLSIVEYEKLPSDVLILFNGDTYDGFGPWIDEANHYSANYMTQPHPITFSNATHTFGFDGYNKEDLLTVAVDIGPTAHPNLTIEVWFRMDTDYDVTQTKGWIVGHDNGGYDRSMTVSDARYGGMGQGVGFTYSSGLGYPSVGDWHQGIAVFAQGVEESSFVALDGRLGTKVTANNGEGNSNFTIGGLNNYMGHGFNGDIALVKIYNKALTDNEVAIAYRSFYDRMRNEPNPETPSNVDEHRGFKVGEVVANLRADMDYALENQAVIDGDTKIVCMGQGGTWAFYSGHYADDNETVSIDSKRALQYTNVPNAKAVVQPKSFLDRSANNGFRLPGVKNGQLISGENEGFPDANEVTVHPGDPQHDPDNNLLVIEFSPSFSGWYVITGSVRDLGADVDSVVIDLLWTDADGGTNSETLGEVGKAVEAFQRTTWMGVGMSFSIVIGANTNFYSDMSALTLIVSAADNFSPFDFGSDGSNITKAGAVILTSANTLVDLSRPYTYRGIQVSYSRDLPLGVSDAYSIEVDTVNAEHGVTNVAFSASVNVSCGETIQYSAWVRITNTLPTTNAASLDSIGLATRTMHADPWHIVSCEDQLDNVADKHTCLARIGYLRGMRGLSEREARIRVGQEFPTECGACANIVSPLELSQCPETTDWLEQIKDVYAAKDLYGGNFSCGARIEWTKNNRNRTQEEAMIIVAGEFPEECGCLAKIQLNTWTWIYGTKKIDGSLQSTQLEVGLIANEEGMVLQFTDFDIVKLPPGNNLGSESTASDVTPSGFYIGGYHELLDLTYNYTNPQKTMTVVYSSDVPTNAVDPRSIEFTVINPGPFAWLGYRVPICRNDLIRMSVWLKFLDVVPTYGNESCFMQSNGYEPLDGVVGQTRTVTTTAELCQQRCEAVAECGYFSWSADGGCHITSADAKISAAGGNSVTTGPKSCGDTMNDFFPGTYAMTYTTGAKCNYTIQPTGRVTTVADCNGWVGRTHHISLNTITNDEYPWMIGEGGNVVALARWSVEVGELPELTLSQYTRESNTSDYVLCCTATGVGDISVGTYAKTSGGGGIGLKHHASGPVDSGDDAIYSDFLPSMQPNVWTYVSKTWTADYTANDLLILIMDSAPKGTRGRFCDLRTTKIVHEPVLFFGGDGGYIHFTDTSELPIADSPYTIEAWIKAYDHGVNGVIGWGDWGLQNSVTSLSLDDGGAIRHAWGNHDLVDTSVGDLEDDKWHHVAAIYDGENRTIVIDGIERKRDKPGRHTTVAADFRIGSTNEGAYFEGGIAEVRVWEVARTAEQIHMFMQAEIDPAEEGLVGYWPLNDGGNSIRDLTNNHNSGLLIGDVTYHSHDSFPPIYRTLDDEFVVTVDDEMGVMTTGEWAMTTTTEGNYLEVEDGYELCAVEHKVCACDGLVRYGANGKFAYKKATGNIDCSNSVFGDPIYGTVKKCHCLSAAIQNTQLLQFEIQVPIPGTYDVSIDMIYTGAAPNITVVHRSGLSVVAPAKSAQGWGSVGHFRFAPGPAIVLIERNGSTTLAVHGVRLTPATGDDIDDESDGWNGQCKIVNTEYSPGLFHYQVFPESLPTRATTFSVRAANDAHVGLFVNTKDAQPGDMDVMYEIVIGGWGNTQSVIRRSPQGANLVTTSTPAIVDKNEWRQFWITFSDGLIVLGTGLTPGVSSTVVMQYQDPTPLPVTYVGVGTGFNAGGAFDVCSVHDGDVISGEVRCTADEFVVDGTTCQKVRGCESGQDELKAPSATSDRVCRDCVAGTTDADSRWQTPCVSCTGGHHTSPKTTGACNLHKCPQGTTTDDASQPCTTCPPQTYNKDGWLRCWPWRICAAVGSEEVPNSASSISNRICRNCTLGVTFRNSTMSSCEATTVCQADEHQTTAPTTSSDRVCKERQAQKCDVGQFRNTPTTCVDCEAGTTDDDYNYATPCVQCPPGSYMPLKSSGPCARFVCDPGSADADSNPTTPCVACQPLVTYQANSNATQCTWVGKVCGAGFVEDKELWNLDAIAKYKATYPRPCVACATGSYKGVSDTTCLQVNASCDDGYEEAHPPTSISNRECSHCELATFSIGGKNCEPWTRCTLGQQQVQGGTASSDRVCVDIPTTTHNPKCGIVEDLDGFVDCLRIRAESKDALRVVFKSMGITTLDDVGYHDVSVMMSKLGPLNSDSDRSIILKALTQLHDDVAPTLALSPTPQSTSKGDTVKTTSASASASASAYTSAYTSASTIVSTASVTVDGSDHGLSCFVRTRLGDFSPVRSCSAGEKCYFRNPTQFDIKPCYGVCSEGVCSALPSTASTATPDSTPTPTTTPPLTTDATPASTDTTIASDTTANHDNTPTPDAAPLGDNSTSSIGLEVGGIVAGLVIVIGVIGMFLWIRMRKQSDKASTYQQVSTNQAFDDDDLGNSDNNDGKQTNDDDDDDDVLLSIDSTENMGTSSNVVEEEDDDSVV